MFLDYKRNAELNDFSAELNMTDTRKCMDPSTLEMVIMLDENSDHLGLTKDDDMAEDEGKAGDLDMDVDSAANT